MRSPGFLVLALGLAACGGTRASAVPSKRAVAEPLQGCDASEGSTDGRGVVARTHPRITVNSVRARTRRGDAQFCEGATLESGDGLWFELDLSEPLYLFALNQFRETEDSAPVDTLAYPVSSIAAPEPFGPGRVRFPPAPDELALDRNQGIDRVFLVASKVQPPPGPLSAEGLWEWLGEGTSERKEPPDSVDAPLVPAAGTDSTASSDVPASSCGAGGASDSASLSKQHPEGEPKGKGHQRRNPIPRGVIDGPLSPINRGDPNPMVFVNRDVYLRVVLIRHEG